MRQVLKIMSKRLLILLVLAGLAGFAGNMASGEEESLPPLKDGMAPANLDELWGNYDPRKEPLETGILKQWKQDGVVLEVVRYRIGIFKGQKSMMVAIYGYPEGGTNLPGLVQLHGGGQSANVNAVLTNAKRGYACISLNWGGNPLGGISDYHGPNTDWGAVDATQNGHNDHYTSLEPDSKTIDNVKSGRNNNWFLITLAARRALTFLERQPEVDGGELGVYGHSMGGNLTLYVAATDQRVKAGVITSGGGVEDMSDNIKNTPFNNAAYAARVTCPVLFVNPADDFHGTILGVEDSSKTIRSKDYCLVRPPYLNHRSMPEFTVTGLLWFDHYLKGAPALPQTPAVSWVLDAPRNVPRMTVKPDPTQACEQIDVYYTQQDLETEPKSMPHNTERFWYHVTAHQTKTGWTADLPLMSINHPLWAYANVRYALPRPITGAGFYYALYTSRTFSISSRLLIASPQVLQTAGVKPALKPATLIESFRPGWQAQWYTYNESGEWPWRTHKLNADEWQAPTHAMLGLKVHSAQPNLLVIQLDDFATQIQLKGGNEWQTVSLSPPDFHDAAGTALASWRNFGELVLADKVTLETTRDGRHQTVPLGADWQGADPEFRSLHWIEGAK